MKSETKKIKISLESQKFKRFLTEIKNKLIKLSQRSQITNAFNLEMDFHQIRFKIWFNDLFSLVKNINYSKLTFYLGLEIFDSISSRFAIPEHQVLVFALICLDLAAKIHQPRNEYLDFIEKNVRFTNFYPFNVVKKSDLVIMQKKIIFFFDFRMNLPTIVDFVFLILSVCEKKDQHLQKFKKCAENPSKEILWRMIHAVSLTYENNRFSRLGLACGVVFCWRACEEYQVIWPKELQEVTSVDPNDLCEVIHFVFKRYNMAYSHEKDYPKLNEKSCYTYSS